jgi:sporulation-control protein
VLSAGFREVEVTLGRVAEGVAQELGFSVWLRFASPVAYAERIKEVGLTFIASQRDLCVVLGADRRGLLGGDVFGNYTMTHEEAGAADWASLIGGWLAEVARKS